METIKEKYSRYREIAKDGDIVLVHNPKIFGKIIAFCDKAYWTHVFTTRWDKFGGLERLFLIEEGFEGAGPAFMSNRIGLYSDLLILRPKRSNEIIDSAVCYMINEAESGVSYAIRGGAAGLLERFFKNYFDINIKLNWGSKKEEICSQWGQATVQRMFINDFDSIRRMFPHDFIRFYNPESFDIIEFKNGKTSINGGDINTTVNDSTNLHPSCCK